MSWQAVVAVILVLLVAALVFAIRVARAEQSSLPQPVTGPTPAGVVGRSVPSAFATRAATGVGAAAQVGASTAGGATTTGTAGDAGGAAGAGGAGSRAAAGGAKAEGGAIGGGAPQAAKIMVHVVGQVARPGVVALSQGGRVVDALALAGGASPGADLQHVNLARVLVDGEQVYVPKPGEAFPAASGPAAGGASAAKTGSGGGSASGLVNLNTADLTALDGLPGLGPVLAQRILDWRTEHGRFTTVDELGEVSGIGEKLLSQIRTKVTV